MESVSDLLQWLRQQLKNSKTRWNKLAPVRPFHMRRRFRGSNLIRVRLALKESMLPADCVMQIRP